MENTYRINPSKKCQICGNNTKSTEARFCSSQCKQFGMKKAIKYKKNCKNCKVLFKGANNQIYCCIDCRDDYYHNKSPNKYSILRRDNFKCIYCGKSSIEDGVKLHVDHIVPKSKGGKNVRNNYITSCEDCNLEKGVYELPQEVIDRIQKIINQNE